MLRKKKTYKDKHGTPPRRRGVPLPLPGKPVIDNREYLVTYYRGQINQHHRFETKAEAVEFVTMISGFKDNTGEKIYKLIEVKP